MKSHSRDESVSSPSLHKRGNRLGHQTNPSFKHPWSGRVPSSILSKIPEWGWWSFGGWMFECLNFLNRLSSIKDWNHTFISSIPKVKQPLEVKILGPSTYVMFCTRWSQRLLWIGLPFFMASFLTLSQPLWLISLSLIMLLLAMSVCIS